MSDNIMHTEDLTYSIENKNRSKIKLDFWPLWRRDWVLQYALHGDLNLYPFQLRPMVGELSRRTTGMPTYTNILDLIYSEVLYLTRKRT